MKTKDASQKNEEDSSFAGSRRPLPDDAAPYKRDVTSIENEWSSNHAFMPL